MGHGSTRRAVSSVYVVVVVQVDSEFGCSCSLVVAAVSQIVCVVGHRVSVVLDELSL